jgi:hypothetical protein
MRFVAVEEVARLRLRVEQLGVVVEVERAAHARRLSQAAFRLLAVVWDARAEQRLLTA